MQSEIDPSTGRIHPEGWLYDRTPTSTLTSRVVEQALEGDVAFTDLPIDYEGNKAWARLDNFRVDESDPDFVLANIKISKHRTPPESLENVEWEEVQEVFRADRRADTIVTVLDPFLTFVENSDDVVHAETHPHRKKIAAVLGTTAVVVGLAGIEIWRHRHKKAKS